MIASRHIARQALTALAVVLVPLAAVGVTSPAYRGLVYPERPVATIPLLAGLSVNTLTGNLVVGRTLFTVPSRGVPFEAFLVYNSDRRLVASPFGKGWSFSYGMRYVDDGAGNVRVIWGDGRVDLFLASGGGAFTAPAGLFATLSTPAPGQLLLRTKRGVEYRFLDASHRKLTAIADPNGNTLALAYDALARLEWIADAAGREWYVTYDGRGRVVMLSDPGLSRSISFAYDAGDRLTGITDALGSSETFGYDGDDLLTAVTDRRGNTATITYTGAPDNRRVASVNKGGSTMSLAYNAGTRTTTLTDANGGGWQYAYSPSILLVSATDPLGESATFIWGTDKNLLEYTDRRGTASTFDYDTAGNLTRATVPLTVSTSAVTASTYDPTCNRPATFTDPRGSTWSFAYDAHCNLTTITDPAALGTSASISPDALGQPVQVTDRTGRNTSYVYDAAGNPATRTDALGHTWMYEFDSGSRLTQTEDPLGNQRAFAYDALDRLLTATDALGSDATYEYDDAGNLLRFTDREGNQTQWAYDAIGRLAGTTDALGNSDTYAYDPAGNLTMYTDRRGAHWLAAFDAAHRVVSRTNPLGKTWTYGYDANGNLATHTDALGRLNTNTFDLANRLVQRDFVGSRRITFDLDAAGDLVASKDEVVGTAFVYGNYAYAYDAGRRRTSFTDKLQARTVTYAWDGDGRLLTKTLPSNQPTVYTYDGAGRLASLAAFAGAGTFTYDDPGNLVAETRANGISSAYAYDANDRLLSTVIHAPAVPPAPGLAASAASVGAVLRSWVHTRDLDGRITATLRETGEYIAYTLDALGRVTLESGDLAALGGAYTLTLGYDENGNRPQRDLASATLDRTQTVTFDAASLASSMTTTAGGAPTVVNFTHDANGALTLAQRVDPPGLLPYYYDARNRLYQVGATGSNPRTFSLDQFGRLVYTAQGADTLRIMYGSDDPAQMYGSQGGTVFSYTCAQRTWSSSLCNDPLTPLSDSAVSDKCPLGRCRGSSGSCDEIYSCREANSAKTYQLHWGGNRGLCGAGFGRCDGDECAYLDNAVAIDEGAAVTAEANATSDGVPREETGAPRGLDWSLAALGAGRFRLGGLVLAAGDAFDPVLGQSTAEGGERGASRSPTQNPAVAGPSAGGITARISILNRADNPGVASAHKDWNLPGDGLNSTLSAEGAGATDWHDLDEPVSTGDWDPMSTGYARPALAPTYTVVGPDGSEVPLWDTVWPIDVPEEFLRFPLNTGPAPEPWLPGQAANSLDPGASSLVDGTGSSYQRPGEQRPRRVAVARPSSSARLMALTLGVAGVVLAIAPSRRRRSSYRRQKAKP